MPKLIYFDIYGRAEMIRMLLWHAKVTFEDDRMSFEQFGERKAAGEFPSGQVPQWVCEDGEKLSQSGAILRYLGIQHGYYPKDPRQAYTVDWACDTVADEAAKKHIRHYLSPTPPTEDEMKTAGADAAISNAAFEAHFKKTGNTFMAGKDLTIADFLLVAWHNSFARNTKEGPLTAVYKAELDKCPLLSAYLDRVATQLVGYLSTRPACIA